MEYYFNHLRFATNKEKHISRKKISWRMTISLIRDLSWQPPPDFPLNLPIFHQNNDFPSKLRPTYREIQNNITIIIFQTMNSKSLLILLIISASLFSLTHSVTLSHDYYQYTLFDYINGRRMYLSKCYLVLPPDTKDIFTWHPKNISINGPCGVGSCSYTLTQSMCGMHNNDRWYAP